LLWINGQQLESEIGKRHRLAIRVLEYAALLHECGEHLRRARKHSLAEAVGSMEEG
jgi:hypothetical protein